VTGSIHALAGGTAGAQFTAALTPKLIASGTSGTNQFVYANNSTQSINDFDGTDATGAATGLTFGSGNNANNTAFINSLRGGGASTNPSGTGAANPSSVQQGGSTLLTVTMTPGTNPTSTGLAVSADLSAIGGSTTQSLFDGGTHGDAVAGDNLFSFQANVPPATNTGSKTIPAIITDAQSRSGSTTISLTVSMRR
jgi:hypothetical protein